MVSPAGDLLCPRRQSRQSATGGRRLEKHSVFLCRLPPDPPFVLRGSHQGARLYPSGAGKGQDTVPCADRCRSVLVEQADAPTRAIAPGFQISRGGSVVAPPPWLVLRAGEWLQHSRPLGLQRPFGPLTSAPIPALEFSGYRQPPGVHPIGGRGPLIGRFKGMGYLGEGGNRNPPSSRQLFGNFLSAQKVTRPGAKHPKSSLQAKSPRTLL